MNKIVDDFNCKICNKIYSNYNSFWTHNKKFHNQNVQNVQQNVQNVQLNVQNVQNNKLITCDFCNKIFNNRSSKSMHKKKCNILPNKDLELEKIILEKIKEQNKLLKLKIKLQNIKRLDNKTFKAVNKYLMDRSYNINSNNVINNNYQILSIGKEQLGEVLSLSDKKEIMNSKLCALEKIVEIAHCGKYNYY